MDLSLVGRWLIGAGIALLVLGVLVLIAGRLPLLSRLGWLPGDILLRRGPVTIYVPLLTSLLLSLLVTLVLNLIFRR